MVDVSTLVDLPEDGGWGPVHRLEDGMLPTGGAVDLAANQGILNWPLQQLAGRTAFLNAQINLLLQAGAGAITEEDVNALIAAAINNIIDGAPGALDTLQELATALGDNDDAIAALTGSIATKLNASSYTAADILAKLIAVDGAGSGLDADKLDGIDATGFVQTARSLTAGTGLTGGGNLSADRTISANIATQAEAEAGSIATKLMTPQRVAQAIAAMASTPPIASQAEARAGTDNTRFMTPLRVIDTLLRGQLLNASFILASVKGTATGVQIPSEFSVSGFNYLFAGSDLTPAGISYDTSSMAATGYEFVGFTFRLSGTWRSLGCGPDGTYSGTNNPNRDYITLFQRIY